MESSRNTTYEKLISYKEQIIDILIQLNKDDPVDCNDDINELCCRNVQSVAELSRNLKNIKDVSTILNKYNSDDQSYQWKYISLSTYYLLLLENILKTDCLSVQQIKQLKNVFRNIIGIGIASNLLPNVPYHIKLPSEENTLEKADILRKYKRLTQTTFIMYQFLLCTHLKSLVLTNIKWILSSFYQVIYAPLKKPSPVPTETGFVMTEKTYKDLRMDKQEFTKLLKEFSNLVHPLLYIREIMMLTGSFSTEKKAVPAPMWFRKGVYSTLNEILSGTKGVENITLALLDAAGLDSGDDTTKSWKALDIIGKMIMDSQKLTDFRDNVCNQVLELLKLRDKSNNAVKPFERLVALCTILLFQQDEVLCQDIFIKHLLKPLANLSDLDYKYKDDVDVTETISQTLRLLRLLFIEQNLNMVLPIEMLSSQIYILFFIYSVTFAETNFKYLNEDLKIIILKILDGMNIDTMFSLFDNLLFGISCENTLQLNKNIELLIEDSTLKIKNVEYSVGNRSLKIADILKSLLKEDLKMTITLFNYLLNCLINSQAYFKEDHARRDLLQLENEFVLDDVLERKFAVYKLLTELSEREDIQKKISEDPAEIIDCMKKLFIKSVEDCNHKSEDVESDGFQTIFVIITLLEVLIENGSEDSLSNYSDLIKPLEIFSIECPNKEVKDMALRILSKLNKDKNGRTTKNIKTELDKALEEICDPLLPVRGHGLMRLAKLVEKKDETVLERKQYILNIFRMNLKDEDSYIYLSAVSGLAAMGDIFPDTVLNALTDEYSGFSRKDSEDGHEIRIKLGEVLVRVTKLLGDMAPKYKSLLLNTFLMGTKDEDLLIRASSLSNLGEICRVLGYKLGSIVTEVLVCVHGIITGDKAVEARRAAVTVIRQLFVGLEKETIVILKDEILPIYRTLKSIYYNDADDVMRLQAQLALEELNENMRNFIFPTPVLHAEKKFVIME